MSKSHKNLCKCGNLKDSAAKVCMDCYRKGAKPARGTAYRSRKAAGETQEQMNDLDFIHTCPSCWERNAIQVDNGFIWCLCGYRYYWQTKKNKELAIIKHNRLVRAALRYEKWTRYKPITSLQTKEPQNERCAV